MNINATYTCYKCDQCGVFIDVISNRNIFFHGEIKQGGTIELSLTDLVFCSEDCLHKKIKDIFTPF